MAQAGDQTFSPEVGVAWRIEIHQTGVTLRHSSYRECRGDGMLEKNGFGRGDKVAYSCVSSLLKRRARSLKKVKAAFRNAAQGTCW